MATARRKKKSAEKSSKLRKVCKRCSYYTGGGNNYYKCHVAGECPAFDKDLEDKSSAVESVSRSFPKGWIRTLASMGFTPMRDRDENILVNDDGEIKFESDVTQYTISGDDLRPERIVAFILEQGEIQHKEKVERAWKETGLLALFGKDDA